MPAAAITLSLTSCLEVAETITLKKDGSGTIVEETILGAQMSAMMTQLAALGGGAEGKNEMFSEEAAKKRAAAIGTGVTVEKVEKIDNICVSICMIVLDYGPRCVAMNKVL